MDEHASSTMNFALVAESQVPIKTLRHRASNVDSAYGTNEPDEYEVSRPERSDASDCTEILHTREVHQPEGPADTGSGDTYLDDGVCINHNYGYLSTSKHSGITKAPALRTCVHQKPLAAILKALNRLRFKTLKDQRINPRERSLLVPTTSLAWIRTTRRNPHSTKFEWIRLGEFQEDDEGDDERGTKRARPGSLDISPRKLLACPFWKSDARRHRECFKLKLDGISRVKQHISRSHYHENQCGRCKMVFVEDLALQVHLKQGKCCWRGPEMLEGISHQQRNALTKKSKPQHSESEKWFAIWEIIFPGQQCPSSAYMDPTLSEDLSEFRLYAQTHGTRIIMEELNREGLSNQLQSSEEMQSLLRAALGRGQDLVFDAWLDSRASSSRTPASFTRISSSNNNLSEQSLTDSGVALESQQESGITPFHSTTETRTFDIGEPTGNINAPGEIPTGTQCEGDQLLEAINSDFTEEFSQPLVPWSFHANDVSWSELEFEQNIDFDGFSYL
ncbi:hypothetical protein PG987_011716 [Apiospora arundinis]